jgi:hypothetical protein
VASLESSEGGGKVVFSNIDEVTVAVGFDDEWPNSLGEGSLTVPKENELLVVESRRYNFRVKNNAKTEKTFTMRAVLIPRNPSTTPPATEMISGMDALAMFLCIVGVFIVFSILATLTMRLLPKTEGTLVVEEDDLE